MIEQPSPNPQDPEQNTSKHIAEINDMLTKEGHRLPPGVLQALLLLVTTVLNIFLAQKPEGTSIADVNRAALDQMNQAFSNAATQVEGNIGDLDRVPSRYEMNDQETRRDFANRILEKLITAGLVSAADAVTVSVGGFVGDDEGNWYLNGFDVYGVNGKHLLHGNRPVDGGSPDDDHTLGTISFGDETFFVLDAPEYYQN